MACLFNPESIELSDDSVSIRNSLQQETDMQCFTSPGSTLTDPVGAVRFKYQTWLHFRAFADFCQRRGMDEFCRTVEFCSCRTVELLNSRRNISGNWNLLSFLNHSVLRFHMRNGLCQQLSAFAVLQVHKVIKFQILQFNARSALDRLPFLFTTLTDPKCASFPKTWHVYPNPQIKSASYYVIKSEFVRLKRDMPCLICYSLNPRKIIHIQCW